MSFIIATYTYIHPGAVGLQGSQTPDGAGRIWLDDVACTSLNTRLIDCTNRGLGVHNCVHSEDAGVRCSGDYKLTILSHYLN